MHKQEDEFIWYPAPNGEFKTKTGYWWKMNLLLNHPPLDLCIKRICKLNMWPKLKFFVWKILHGCLPTKDRVRRKGIQIGQTCTLCSLEEEDAEHLFRKCELSKRIWAGSPLGIRNDYENSIPTGEWIKGFINYFFLQDKDHSRSTFFIHIMWAIWLERNNRVFRNHSSQLQHVLKEASLIFGYGVAGLRRGCGVEDRHGNLWAK